MSSRPATGPIEGALRAAGHRPNLHLPGLVTQVDLVDGLQAIANPGADDVERGDVWLLVRLGGRAIGLTVAPLGAGLTASEIGAAIHHQLGSTIAERVGRWVAAGELVAGVACAVGRPSRATSTLTTTVAICTRDRPESLRRCLASIATQTHRDADVLVVDNAPSTTETRAVVDEFRAQLRVRYALERRRGVSFARNTAISLATGDVVAWIDDDEVADDHWLAEIVAAFGAHPQAVAVSGLVLPAELETPAQLWFERFGGLSKGRGFHSEVFRRGDMAQNHLYPLPPFGVGANMAFRRTALERVHGFDAALGAGTRTGGAEDTLVFTQLLELGETCVYHPDAITWHTHRRTMDGLGQQMKAYGTGLTAFYTSLVLWRPSTMPRLARLLPVAWRDLRDGDSLRNAGVGEGMPGGLLQANARQMLAGPWRYLRARRRARALRVA